MMKNKLEKTGHKSAFYRLRAFLIALLIVVGAIGALAIPIGVSYGVAAARAAADSSRALDSSLEAGEPNAESSPITNV